MTLRSLHRAFPNPPSNGLRRRGRAHKCFFLGRETHSERAAERIL